MTATARLDRRLGSRDKDKIAHAADLRGIPVATFVHNAALHEAGRVWAMRMKGKSHAQTAPYQL